MKQRTDDLRQSLIFQPSLLSFESQREYRQPADAIRDHISPQDILEEIWTSEIVEGEWEIVRLRRSKGQIVNLDKLVSLRNLLQLILPHASDAEIDDLTRRRFTNKEIRKQVTTLLHSIDLDDSAIEVEAYRSRRDKSFRQIEDRRAGIAVPPGHRLVDQEVKVPIEHHGGDT